MNRAGVARVIPRLAQGFSSRFIPVLALILLPTGTRAYESDQYYHRTEAVADSLVPMNRQVNQAIQRLLKKQFTGKIRTRQQTEKAFARAIYYELGGWYWADKIERWAARSPDIEKYPGSRHRSVYRAMPIWATRVNYVFGVGRSFRVNDVMVGSDKFGHFISQGYKYFRRELRHQTEAQILARGAFAEYWLFGKLTTGVYSNADLVANYEGWRFYQSLFRDEIIEGKPAILARRDGRMVQQRQFTWADHINEYWDEALNPSHVVKALNWRLREFIRDLCPEFAEQPEFFVVANDEALWQKYQHIGLLDARENQFQAVCSEQVMPE